MENKENLSVHSSRNLRMSHNPDGSESVRRRNSTPKPSTAKESSEPEESQKRKKSSEGGRRPSTASGSFRWRRVDSYERSPIMQKSRSFATKAGGSPMRERRQSRGKEKPPQKNRKGELAEGFALFLPQAIEEQAKMMKTLEEMREELRGKLTKKMTSGGKTDFTGDFEPSANCAKFETSYSGTLEEIFQAWVNLFYFIINLRVNLLRLLVAPGAEPFAPNLDAEREVVGQAIECVKLFSRLKMKSLVNSLDDLCLPDRDVDEAQIREFEERISLPFLTEMDFMQTKSKEMVEQLRKQSRKSKGEEKRGRSEFVSKEEG